MLAVVWGLKTNGNKTQNQVGRRAGRSQAQWLHCLDVDVAEEEGRSGEESCKCEQMLP